MYFNGEMYGEYIRKLRTKHGYTMEDVYHRTGIHRTTLSKIEKGNSIPKIETLQLLSLLFNVDLISMISKYCNLNYEVIGQELDLIKGDIADEDTTRVKALYDMLIERKEHEILDETTLKHLEKQCIFLKVFYETHHPKPYNLSKKKWNEDIRKLERLIDETDMNNEYSYLDYQISFLIAGLYRKNNDFQKSIEALDAIATVINQSFLEQETVVELNLILYSNYVFVYSILEKYDQCLEMSNKGIELSLEHSNFIAIHFFHLRKGISLFYLNRKDYVEEIKKAMYLLEVMNKQKMKNSLLKSLEYFHPKLYKVYIDNFD